MIRIMVKSQLFTRIELFEAILFGDYSREYLFDDIDLFHINAVLCQQVTCPVCIIGFREESVEFSSPIKKKIKKLDSEDIVKKQRNYILKLYMT